MITCSGKEGLTQNLLDIYKEWTVFTDTSCGYFGKADTDEAFLPFPRHCTLGKLMPSGQEAWAVA